MEAEPSSDLRGTPTTPSLALITMQIPDLRIGSLGKRTYLLRNVPLPLTDSYKKSAPFFLLIFALSEETPGASVGCYQKNFGGSKSESVRHIGPEPCSLMTLVGIEVRL